MKQDLPVVYGRSSLGDYTALKGDLQDTIGAVLKKEILQGRLLRATLSSTPLEIPHNLGRTYQGYIVVKRETWDATNSILVPGTPYTGSVYEAASANSELFISLYSTSGVAVNVWVF